MYVAGHRGLVGSAILRLLHAEGFTDVLGRTSAELDLRDRPAVHAFLRATRPGVVIDAAAKVGGILANDDAPADFISENLQLQANLMDAAAQVGVPRLLFLGSSCIYPRDAAQPIREDSLMTGPLEPTNDAYAVAKIAGIQQVRAVRRQYGLPWISAMPTNLYGPGDNFDLTQSHVVPALLRRFAEAAGSDAPEVVLWGTGTPRREFLYVDDLARACLVLLERYDSPDPVNVGTGTDLSIRELADVVAGVVGFTGRISTDPTKPDGTPRKLLDVSRIMDTGWRPRVGLRSGLQATWDWYRSVQPVGSV